MEEMQGRIYDERSISLYYVPRDLYYQNFKKNITPPAIKEKKWFLSFKAYIHIYLNNSILYTITMLIYN